MTRKSADVNKAHAFGAKMMKPAVEKLTEDDLIAITACVASLQP